MTSHTDAQLLFQQGIAALKAGDKIRACALFTQVVQHDSHHQPALLWLSSVVDSADERRAHLEQVISINPGSEAGKRAQAGLKRLQAMDLPSVEQIVPESASSAPQSQSSIGSHSHRAKPTKAIGQVRARRPRRADDMLRMVVGCCGGLGMLAGLFPQMLTGWLGLLLIGIGALAAFLHVVATLRFRGSIGRGLLEVVLFGAIAFAGVYGCFWYFTVYLASQPLFVFSTTTPPGR